MRPISGALPDGDRAVIGTFVMAAALLAALLPLAANGTMSPAAGAATGVALTSLIAGMGALVTVAAVTRTGGVEAQVWGLFAKGLTCWTLGCVPYFIFLATGGDISDPQAWSQIGFLAAYPFWYRALWLLRQPALDESRRQRIDGFAIELSVLAILFVIVVAALWEGSLSALENIALQVPVALDLLLLAALYNAVRRSSVTHRTAFVWFAYAFVVLAMTDAAVTYLVTRSAGMGTTGLAMFGYMIALALMGIAARRPIRVTEARAVLGPSKTIIAAVGLGLSGPATILAPSFLWPVVWALAAFLLWRIGALVRVHGQSDTDPLSGFLEARAFTRHVGGVVQAASSTRPALLITVDLDGFGRWNAQHGYGAGDALLADLAARLEGSSLTGGVWSRLGADRFAWVGMGHDGLNGRLLAEAVHDIASTNNGGLAARAAFVVLPDDAATAANAIAASEEALAAAHAGDRRVVAFDRGRLDGLEYATGYTASLAQRREAILEVLHAPETIATVFQPIVSLENGGTVGYESLSRFRAEPERPPDKWIAEAHAVGLGLEIEVECVRRALALRGRITGDRYLSVNMSPDAILTPEMEAALGDGPLDGLVIEITEHDAVGDYARLAARLADYRGRGARVAIDDTGAGQSNFMHVAELAPDYIKIDRNLIHDIHVDHAKRALVRSIVSLEEDLGAKVVAEGVERPEELRILREIGVPLAQGYLLARPSRDPWPAPWTAAMLELADAGGSAG